MNCIKLLTILGDQQLAGDRTFHIIQWEINCNNTVQIAKGAFSFLNHVIGNGIIIYLSSHAHFGEDNSHLSLECTLSTLTSIIAIPIQTQNISRK